VGFIPAIEKLQYASICVAFFEEGSKCFFGVGLSFLSGRVAKYFVHGILNCNYLIDLRE